MRRDDCRGLITAELAVGILSAMVVMIMLAWGLFLVVVQVRCIDAAAEIARQAARDDHEAVDQARAKAPAGSRIKIKTAGDVVQVEVRTKAKPLRKGLPAIELNARAEAVREPEGDQ